MKKALTFLAILLVCNIHGYGSDNSNIVSADQYIDYGPYPPSYLQYYSFLYSTNSLHYWSYLYHGLNNPYQIYTAADFQNMPWLKQYMNQTYGADARNQPVFNPTIYNNPSTQPRSAATYSQNPGSAVQQNRNTVLRAVQTATPQHHDSTSTFYSIIDQDAATSRPNEQNNFIGTQAQYHETEARIPNGASPGYEGQMHEALQDDFRMPMGGGFHGGR
ncbi:MAG: hypothetical protein WCR55_08980 [Lentisphaerota bacterium]